MYLDESHKIERYDKLNIALFKRNGFWPDGRERWDAKRFYSTWEKAIADGIKYLTLDEMSLNNDSEAKCATFKSCLRHIDHIAKYLALQIKDLS